MLDYLLRSIYRPLPFTIKSILFLLMQPTNSNLDRLRWRCEKALTSRRERHKATNSLDRALPNLEKEIRKSLPGLCYPHGCTTLSRMAISNNVMFVRVDHEFLNLEFATTPWGA